MERKGQGYPAPAANRDSSSVASAPTHISPGIKIKGQIVADEDLHIDGYVVDGIRQTASATVPLSNLFHHLPVAVLKARLVGAIKPARKSAQMA